MRRETVWFLSVLNIDKHRDPPVREDRWGPNLWFTGYCFCSTRRAAKLAVRTAESI
jgi:hypothetical protein